MAMKKKIPNGFENGAFYTNTNVIFTTHKMGMVTIAPIKKW
jgi:hypothetical protein